MQAVEEAMPVPEFVTFTGVDDRTDLSRLSDLSTLYPIEWGVLLGSKGKDDERYPTARTIEKLLACGVRLAAHVCRHYSDEILLTGKSILWPFDGFRRVQVNAVRYGGDYRRDDMPFRVVASIEALEEFADSLDKPVIMQCRGQSFPDPAPKRIYCLHDMSGGKGIMPARWPAQPAHLDLVGYAGGIGPDNVQDILQRIEAQRFWIDMETNVRTDGVFDLGKCEAVCKAIWK